MHTTAILNLALVMALGQSTGDAARIPAEPKDATSRSAQALEAFKAEAKQYEMRLESSPPARLKLEKDPVLRWDNPARTGEDGALFVWMGDGGRPEAIGTIFTYRFNDKINRKHEFHSLALSPLTAEFRGKTAWSPRGAGVTFHELEGAPAVAATSRQRLSQMKSLARDFSASMRDAEGQQFQLRLLTQPLLRYEPKGQPVLDGAVFAFSLGTDPEVLLLIEARPGKEGHRWKYALARFHYIELTVRHRQRQVWRADLLTGFDGFDLGAPQSLDSAYSTYHVERDISAP